MLWLVGYGSGMVIYFIWQLYEEGFEWSDIPHVVADSREYIWLVVGSILWPLFFSLNLLIFLFLSGFKAKRWFNRRSA